LDYLKRNLDLQRSFWDETGQRKLQEETMKRILKAIVVVLVVIDAATVFAQEKPKNHALWKWASTSDSAGAKESSMFNSPQLSMPKFEVFEKSKAATGRAFDSAKKTTSKMWNSTVDFLNPWDNKGSTNPKPKNDAWFFQKKEEPEYSTVNDFLKQKRPRF
jgi:hypothetical protein